MFGDHDTKCRRNRTSTWTGLYPRFVRMSQVSQWEKSQISTQISLKNYCKAYLNLDIKTSRFIWSSVEFE